MMDECNHYTHNNQNFYPVIHIDEIEECSNLGSTIDEEAVVEGSVTVAGNGYGNESGGSEDDLNTTRNGLSFNNLSRRINSSGPMKKFFFVGTVFIVLSCVGLSAVGVEKLLRNSGHFAKDSIGREEVASAEEQVERSSDDDLVATPAMAPALTTAPTYLIYTPAPTPATQAWATNPTSTTSNIMEDSITADEVEFGMNGIMGIPESLELSMSMEFIEDMSVHFDEFDSFEFADMSLSTKLDDLEDIVIDRTAFRRMSPVVTPTRTFAPTYIVSTPEPTVSARDAGADIIILDEDIMTGSSASLELSMSTTFHHDGSSEMSMFLEDFEQLDADPESMSMFSIEQDSIAVDDVDITPPAASTTVTGTVASDSTEAMSTEANVVSSTVTDPVPELIKEVLNPVADTFLEFNSTKTYGVRKWIRVDGKPMRVSLIRFDLSSLKRNKAAELLSAKLRLFSLTNSSFGGQIAVVAEDITDEWDEKSLMWTNAPPGVFATPPDSLGSFGMIHEFEWNEAELTLNLQDLPSQFTMKISSDRDNGVTYASKENVTAVPELILEYMGTPSEETDMPRSDPPI